MPHGIPLTEKRNKRYQTRSSSVNLDKSQGLRSVSSKFQVDQLQTAAAAVTADPNVAAAAAAKVAVTWDDSTSLKRSIPNVSRHHSTKNSNSYYHSRIAKDMSDAEDVVESPPTSPAIQSDSDGSVSSGDSGHRPGVPIKCMWDQCGGWFGTLEELASHVGGCHAVAGKGGLFYCGWKGCSRGERGFNARYKMLVHVRTHTNEKPHQCDICDKSFSRAENLKIHARSHTGERPYVCPVVGCGKAYSNSSDRFKHTRTHSVDKPYVCKVPGCPKRYTDPSSLRKHVKTYRHFPNQSGSSAIKTEDYPTTDCATRVASVGSSPIPEVKMEVAYSPRYDYYYPAEPCKTHLELRTGDQAPSSPDHPVCVPATTPHHPPPFPAWPGLLHWYIPDQHQPQQGHSPPPGYTTACYSEQETPLDLTSPIRLQHRV